jgi:hypothetical protein
MTRGERTIGGLTVFAPTDWTDDQGALADPNVPTIFKVGRMEEKLSATEALEAAVQLVHHGGAKKIGFERVELAERTLFTVPAPWISDELVAAAAGVGGEHRYRVVVFVRKGPPGEIWMGSLYCPEVLAKDFRTLLTSMLGSVRVLGED